MQNQFKKISFALAAMTVGALVGGVVMTLPQGIRGDAYAAQTAQSRIAQQGLSAAIDLSAGFRSVAEVLKPSVVSISTSQMITTSGAGYGGSSPQFRGGLPPGFDDLFNDGPARRSRPRKQQAIGSGSGVIIRANGYVLTNNHVVENASRITVELSDGQEMDAVVVGTDPETDLAVLKIDADGLVPVAFGNSDKIRVGDWVLAIGSPFGLNQTVTAGIISGKNRVQGIVRGGNGDGGYEDFLQTDAAINPGNSGGPLVNLRGELVGINTAIMSRSGGNAGIGFAIPISMAQPVLASLIEFGEVRRAFLGVQIDMTYPSSESEQGRQAITGARLNEITANQPGAHAGLQPGDIVTKMDEQLIRDGYQLRNVIARQQPGTSVVLEISRDDRVVNIPVTLAGRNDETVAAILGQGATVLGAKLRPLNAETAEQYGYTEGSGLIVVGVDDDSIAANTGIEVGDIIESVNNRPLTTANELRSAVEFAKEQAGAIRIVVRRGNARHMLGIRVR